MLGAYFKKFGSKKIKRIEVNFLKPTFTNQKFEILLSKKKNIT